MRHFSLLIGKDIRGPLTEDEIKVMIDDGSLAAETPCAPEGAQEWTPLSDHFNFGAKLKIKRTKDVSTEAEDQAASTRIDPDLRKKLLIYGLADATSVDGFTHIQAAAAVTSKEDSLRSLLRSHQRVSMATFLAAIPLALLAGLLVPPIRTALGHVVAAGIPAQASAKAGLDETRNAIMQMRAAIQSVDTTPFDLPQGDIAASEALTNRLRIDPNTSFLLKGEFGFSPNFAKKFSLTGRTCKVRLLKEMPSGKLQELLKSSEEKLAEGPIDWAAFHARHGKELEALLKAATLMTVSADEKGLFSMEAIPPINTSMSGQIVMEFYIKGQKAFTAWTQPNLEQAVWLAEELPPAYFLPREKYSVTAKVEAGGKTYKGRVRNPVHAFDVSKVAPTWRYLAVARKDDKTPLYLRVDEATYRAANVGDPIDSRTISQFRAYEAPAESPAPPRLELR
jgi:uncharacterized membrane protein